MADITTKTVSSLTSDSTLSETDAFVYGDTGGNTLKKSALSVLRNALFGATTLPSTLATSAKNVIGAINELNTNLNSTNASLDSKASIKTREGNHSISFSWEVYSGKNSIGIYIDGTVVYYIQTTV